MLEELYELGEPKHYISWDFCLDSNVVYRHAQVPKDYIRLFLLHVMVTRILRPDADVDLRLAADLGSTQAVRERLAARLSALDTKDGYDGFIRPHHDALTWPHLVTP